tara:strand:+ start:33 stop:947 length:915 start_codon:yes stop_codon:yes gene_type:complete
LATFEQQVEALTGLAIESSSSNPTQAQLTQYLTDGVLDVTQRCIAINPKDKPKFQKVSAETTSNGSLDIENAEIISVVREAGVNNDWRHCRFIESSLQSKVTDKDSLLYASKYNPAYTIDSSTGSNVINVYPVPGSNPDAFKVYYVNNVPVANDNTATAFGDSTIGNFPADKVYLVVLYGAIKSLENAMSAKGIPVVASDSADIELTTIAALDAENTIDDADGNAIEVDQWWSTTGHLIEGAEDLEMASSQLQKINAYIQAYSAQLQGNNTDYQWMQGRHQILSKQYETAFAIMRPAQPQQGAR